MDENTFSINDAIANLWEKLGGWLDALILKLPNFAVAIIVMVLFYFLAKGLNNLSQKLLF
ncbi:MAG: mechanosensitive ion channel protein MscS, partial [Flavobacteriaceae bacterium]|nr:mechanosensitive ion channel protein MscS [Flavobacteriaceae bacterium]